MLLTKSRLQGAKKLKNHFTGESTSIKDDYFSTPNEELVFSYKVPNFTSRKDIIYIQGNRTSTSDEIIFQAKNKKTTAFRVEKKKQQSNMICFRTAEIHRRINAA